MTSLERSISQLQFPTKGEISSNPQSSGAQPLRPPVAGSASQPQNFAPPMPMQFRPVGPNQQAHQFAPASSHQFGPVGHGVPGTNIGLPPGQNQMPHFTQPTQHLPLRQGQPGQAPASSQAIPMYQPNQHITPASLQHQQNAQVQNNQLPNLGSAGIQLSSSYTYGTTYNQPPNSLNTSSQYQHASQMHAPPAATGQPWSASGTQNVPLISALMPAPQQSSVAPAMVTIPSTEPSSSEHTSSDWQEHSYNGKRYYYNKKTKQSSWEKPLELMAPLERADASTVWKEFTTPEGRKYYYNKVTQQSKWTIPEELKLAREQAEKVGSQLMVTETGTASLAPLHSANMTSPNVAGIMAPGMNSTAASSPVQSAIINPVLPSVSVLPNVGVPLGSSIGTFDASSLPNLSTPAIALPAPVTSSTEPNSVASEATTATTSTNHVSSSPLNVGSVFDATLVQNLEGGAEQSVMVDNKANAQLEREAADEEPLVYASKQEAKNAFKALLDSANVKPDWSWDKAVEVVSNDKRFNALKTVGEKKQAFNEYLGQRKKQDAEEKRIKQIKAHEDFTRMLEECAELTSSTRWSKTITLFEDDERFNAVEKPRDREELFHTYSVELHKKERAKEAEELKRNRMEYRVFLESCEFIKANSQWRKVEVKLEDDERCSRLEKLDRLEIFQEYMLLLEKKEEEKKMIEKEQIRRMERKNRDEFRKMMEEDVSAGVLTTKTHWHDYCKKVKESPPYLGVASSSSGSTPKDLFEDAMEELEKRYHNDRGKIKDTMKTGKIALTSTWTFEDFKSAVSEDDSLKGISETNLKLIFDELLERLREKEEKEAERLKEREEKEAKRRRRLADDFSELLHSMKDITAFSSWEESRPLLEGSHEYRSFDEESIGREIFADYVAHLQEKMKEKERKRDEEKARKEKEREEKDRRKEKERKEREREREREKEKEKEKEKENERFKKDETESENIDGLDSYGLKERKRDKGKDRKHRKRHHCTTDDASPEKDDEPKKSRKRHHITADDVSSEKDEEPKKPRKHSSDRKKHRKHGYTTDSDSENRHKRHKRDRDVSRRNGGYEELEDGELGEDAEIH